MNGAEFVADDLDAVLEILERFFAVAFLVIAVGDLAIGLGHAEPVAVVAKMFERLLGVVAADRDIRSACGKRGPGRYRCCRKDGASSFASAFRGFP